MIIKRWASGSVVQTFNTSTANNTLSAGNTASIRQGAVVTGTGIPTGTVVGTIVNSTSLTIINGLTGVAVNPTANGTAVSLTFTDGYVKESAKTNATDLVVDVTALTPVSLFEGAGSTLKIKPAYLPNSVFDSLYFFTTAGATQPSVTNLTTLASNAFIDAAAINRSPLGYYWVQGSAAPALFAANPTGTELVAGKYYKTIWSPAEEDEYSPLTNVELEIGDWLLISKIQGIGTGDGSSSANAIVVTFAVVNNTYELMTGATSSVAGAPGLVPGPGTANRLQFLRGDATWATPTDTNTTYSISTTGDGTNPYAEVIRLTAGGSGSGDDDVKIAVGATSLLTKTATTNSTTTVTIADTSGLLVGQLVTGSGIQVNTLITAITANTSITLSLAAQTSLTGTTLTFSTFGLTIEQASDVITVRHADTSSAANLASAARTYVSGLTFDTFGHVISYSTATETVVDTDTHHQAGIYIGATGQLTNGVTANGATYIKLVENGSIRTSNLIQGSGATTVITDASGNITISSTDTNTTYTAGNGIDLSGTNEFTVSAGVGLTQEAGGLKMTQPFISGTAVPSSAYQVVNNLWFDVSA